MNYEIKTTLGGAEVIFCSNNEDGIPAWKLVLSGKKTLTRRTKPQPVGAIRAVCPTRGVKQVCKIRILSCEDDQAWYEREIAEKKNEDALDEEAEREGFRTWEGLWEWFANHYGDDLPKLYRIEFEKILTIIK